MKRFELTPDQIVDLRHIHRKERDKRAAYKLNAVILLGTGWTLEQVSEALLLDTETLRNYVRLYKLGGAKKLLKLLYMGSTPILKDAEKDWLRKHVESNLYSKAADIARTLYKQLGKKLSTRTVTRLLHELGFWYKKTKLVPGKAEASKQLAFIEHYEKLKRTKSDNDAIYFVDSVHPVHNSESGYAWIKTGEEKEVPSNTGRQRLSINGAIDIEKMHVVSTKSKVTDAVEMVNLVEKIVSTAKNKGKLHIILDNARYNRSKLVQEYVANNSRVELHYLPPYSPNLNVIERLWKFMKEKVIKNKYYETYQGFSLSISKFFQYSRKYRSELITRLTDNFRIASIPA